MSLLDRVSSVMDSSWTNDTTLYFQDEICEISLPDFAKSLCFRTYLQMCKLKYRTDRRSNAEYMSPTGKSPLFRQNGVMLTDFSELVSYVEVKTLGLKTDLELYALAEMNAHMAMVDSVLGNAEMYIAWMDPTVANEVTKPRCGSVHTWPLNSLIPYLKQREMKQVLDARQWSDLSPDEVCERVKKCCQALSIKLGNKKFFFGDKVTALDAVVFGHLFAIVTTVLPNNCLSSIIKDFDNLQNFLLTVNATFFTNEIVASPQIHSR